jgi:hypothetical protein
MRTDVYRPSVINPADFEFVAMGYTGPTAGDIEYVRSERKRFADHMARTGGKFAHIERESGGCDICGAANLYSARFYNRVTNEYITTGLDCAAKLDLGDAILFRDAKKKIAAGVEAATGKAKAQRILGEAGLSAAWPIYVADYDTLPKDWRGDVLWADRTIRDIVGKLVTWGSISEKQVEFLRGLLAKIPERDAEKAAKTAARVEKDANRKPLPDVAGRTQITGTVLTTKTHYAPSFYYGGGEREVLKMLVEHADGWKVYGSVPSELHDVADLKGKTVTFFARIERSKDDDKFGFFSRPTKAAIVGAAS